MTKIRIGLAATLAALIVQPAGAPVQASGEPPAKAAIEVHTTAIERVSLRRRLTLFGKIAPEPAGRAHPAAVARVSANAFGLVSAVPVVLGQTVEQGAVVARLDTRLADAAVERAQASLIRATAEAKRQQQLAELDDSSVRQRELAEFQLAEARAAMVEARTARDLLEIRAPLDGTLLRLDVRTGEVVNAGDLLAEIVDLGRLVAEVRVPAAELPELRVGQAAVVRSAKHEVNGMVDYVGRRIDPATGSAVTRVALDSADGLRPGEFVRVRIVVEERREVLAVPASAVVRGADGSGIVVIVDGGRARLRPVTVGIEDGDRIEISGEQIRAGDRIVTREAYGLPDGAPVRDIDE